MTALEGDKEISWTLEVEGNPMEIAPAKVQLIQSIPHHLAFRLTGKLIEGKGGIGIQDTIEQAACT